MLALYALYMLHLHCILRIINTGKILVSQNRYTLALWSSASIIDG